MTKRTVYLDNAATTPVRPEVLEAMLPYLGSDAFGNPSSAHRFGRAARAGVENAKRQVAEAVGAEPNQVVFTSGGTEADNLAIIGAALAAKDRGGPFRVAVSATEHKAALAAAHAVKHLGGDEVILPVTASGIVEEAALDAALKGGLAVVSVMWVNNEVGTVQPVTDVAALAVANGIPFHTDAIQAVGQIPVDFAASGASALTITGHKLGGPVGVGGLLLGREVSCTPLLHGGGQERDVRSGTLDVPGIAAFAAAVEISVKGQPEYAARVSALRDDLVTRVREVVPDAIYNGDRESRLPGNAHFSFPGCEGDALLLQLDAQGIACSTGSACSAGVAQPSHVLLAMGADDAVARSSLRLTLGHTSTAAEIDELIAALPAAAERARRAGALKGAR